MYLGLPSNNAQGFARVFTKTRTRANIGSRLAVRGWINQTV